MNRLADKVIDRRSFVFTGAAIGGGLVVGLGGCSPSDIPDTWRQAGPKAAALNAWVRIGADNIVTIAVPRSEMGQGVATALPMLVAEELEVDMAMVRFEHPEADGAYVNVVLGLEMMELGEDAPDAVRGVVARIGALLPLVATGGSTSVRDAWVTLRKVGASAREMLVAAAAAEWRVPASECEAASGRVRHVASSREASYGVLAPKAALLAPPEQPRLKAPKDFRIIGKSSPRLDSHDKVTGKAEFGIDVVRPQMLYASIRHAPSFGAKLVSFDAAQISSMRGIVKAVQVGQGVAVIADSWWRADEALRQLPVRWDESQSRALSSEAITGMLKGALDAPPTHKFESRGDAAKTLAGSSRVVSAEYDVPFLAHACMEPMNATGIVDGDRGEVWTGSQSPTFAIWGFAAGANLSKSKVRAHVTLLGGGFGRRIEQDFAYEVGVLARAVPGRAVKLIWSREEDLRSDAYRPAARARIKAAIDSTGQVAAWECHIASQSVAGSFGNRNMPSGDFGAKWNGTNVEGAMHMPYQVPDLLVAHHMIELPVPVGYWRSVGHSHNAFFVESFIDECAAAAGTDPVEYRRKLLGANARHRAVLDLAVAKAGWGEAIGQGRGRGVALHKSFGSIVAQVVEVTVSPDNKLRVDRVVCAVDCGSIVNPDIVAAQMESGIVYGLTAALYGEITIKDGGVEQGNFPDYDMVRMAQMPRIEVHIVPSSDRPGGAGEPATPPIAPALANAIFAATGKRWRSMPLSRALTVA